MQELGEVRWWIYALALAVVLPLQTTSASAADPVRLKYLARYSHQPGPDHLMGVEPVLDHYALVSSNQALTLVDLDALPPGGTQAYVDRLGYTDVFNTVTRNDGYVYANLRQGGLAVVYLDEENLELSRLTTISEAGVFYEKMSVLGDRLYVAAHAYGIRIFDLTNPSAPTLVGFLETGFDDAFAIAVTGDTGYVADGAGGLKIVDLSDESAPTIIAGENPQTAAGTAEDVLIINDHVYVASGGAGVAVYELGNLPSRTLYDTPNAGAHLAHVGAHLAVADIGGLQVFAIEPDGSLTPAARELAMRRSSGGGQVTMRFWYGVSGWGSNRVLTTSWDTMDVYELVDPNSDDQADITASTQRVRFAPSGGDAVVRITNDGSGVLNATNIRTTAPTFTVYPHTATLQPGESLDLTIEYAGGLPGEGLVLIDSNDPDEDPCPIQIFGQTNHLDPGEPAVPFTLEAWTFDHEARVFLYDTFDLEAHAGQVVYFRVFGTW